MLSKSKDNQYLLFFPFAIFISAITWWHFFHAEKLITRQASTIHLLISISILCLAYLISRFILRRSSRSIIIIWHGCWLFIFLIWNIAEYGNLLSQKRWGDPLGFMLFWDSLWGGNEIRKQIISFINVKNLLIVSFIFIFYFAILNQLTKFLNKCTKLQYIFPWIGMIVLCLFLFKYPHLIKKSNKHVCQEPVTAFLELCSRLSSTVSNRYQKKSEIIDHLILNKYTANTNKLKSNVIVIVLDSLRADHMQLYGYPRKTTPFLNQLYNENKIQKVEIAFSGCSESYCGIASILTSHYYHQITTHSLKFNELLEKIGYTTELILVGDHDNFADLGKFYGSVNKKFTFHQTSHPMESDQIVLDYLKTLPHDTEKPKVLFFFLMSAHIMGERFPEFNVFTPANIQPIKSSWNHKVYAQALIEADKTDKYRDEIINNYDNGVLQADWMIQQIFNALNNKGYLKDALIVITGDHGDALGEHGHLGHSYRLYNEDMRIPLLIWDSKQSKIINTRLATHTDIAPTIFARLNLPIPETWVGGSLYSPRSSLSSIHLTRRPAEPCAAVILQENKNILKFIACKSIDNVLSEELYELSTDPGEHHNLLNGSFQSYLSYNRISILRERLNFFYN